MTSIKRRHTPLYTGSCHPMPAFVDDVLTTTTPTPKTFLKKIIVSLVLHAYSDVYGRLKYLTTPYCAIRIERDDTQSIHYHHIINMYVNVLTSYLHIISINKTRQY